eukprot:TRINITY_DN21084_c0_g1_i1.p1 TRINITY_DN21084_c0_g1~~TRINITY_DN21084_c0_g1_i1.p1  ORF type:complete len:191 (-),score=16.34 TRINITY_DN21084_c0_g1_i1:34-606(-)
MIRRPPRSTLSSSSAASDVYKRQVQGVQLGALLAGACTSAPGILLSLVGFRCLSVPGSPVCMGGGVDTGVALISVGAGLIAGGCICCAASHGMRRRRSLVTQAGGVAPACTEMVFGTLGLMVGATMLGFGRLCLRDVHLGACTHFTAVAIVTAGAGPLWWGCFFYTSSAAGEEGSVGLCCLPLLSQNKKE